MLHGKQSKKRLLRITESLLQGGRTVRYAIYVNGQEVENGTEPSTGGSIQGLPAGIHSLQTFPFKCLPHLLLKVVIYCVDLSPLQMASWFLATTLTDTARTTRSQFGTNMDLRKCKVSRGQWASSTSGGSGSPTLRSRTWLFVKVVIFLRFRKRKGSL